MATSDERFSVRLGSDGAFMPVGGLDLTTVRELRDAVDGTVAPGRRVVLDLAQLTFMDSTAIHWLVEVNDVTGTPVVLRNAPPAARIILDVAASVERDDAWVFDGDGESPATA